MGEGNRKGIVAMCAAVACFTTTDGLMKLATETLPASQIIALRGLIALTLMSAVAISARMWRHAGGLLHPLVLLRVFFEMSMIVAYVSALSRLPLANVFSVLQAAPIVMTAFAAFIWGERVSLGRWIAILIGFAGVALIIKPTPSGFEPAMTLALIASLCVAGRDLSTARIPRTLPAILITFSATLGSTLAGGLLSSVETWHPVGQREVLILGGAALALAIGNYAVIVAYRSAPVSIVSPFRYMGVAFAIFFGWMVWGFVPDAIALAGIVIVVLAGLYTIRR
ncbi:MULTISPECIES: DMT family transporter [unclassified Beijerinckia]|uniref:DMT family transporter n=1 Tax=unclassified Beijerinckia TaxID=2638183 RepID=UPI0008947F1B|nr:MULTISPECIES: DMT family transporter [unclassified Beijerinckia]MDH7796203.1 drug/metabolite transporter (DMT)-like permease [Beijerinckia sp. GAS462]SEC34918.1 EamA domain-containing membrane protein RarD [Beijerinckia sp. 28-YEA-48]